MNYDYKKLYLLIRNKKMIKYFCDCCGKEKKSLNSFSYLCHIDTYFNEKCGYVDSELNIN